MSLTSFGDGRFFGIDGSLYCSDGLLHLQFNKLTIIAIIRPIITSTDKVVSSLP
jgi:hypothetical protein